MTKALVVGYGLSGRAAASWLVEQGFDVVVIDDARPAGQAALGELGGIGTVSVEVVPSAARSAELARSADLVVPSPGVPVGHPALIAALASGTEIVSEIELAWQAWAARTPTGAQGGAGGRLVAITGTNGKTTVTTLVTAMLAASGLSAVAAGNLGYSLLEAARRPEVAAGQKAVLVAEVSSFQLEFTHRFAPDVSCWLNFAPDHLDWHPNIEHYARAKAKVWAHQGVGATAVFNADDPVVSRFAAAVPAEARVVSFGTGEATWRVSAGAVEGPDGVVLEAAELPRAFPHDLANAAAAMAVALAAGATPDGCREAARHTPVPPHRVELVAEDGGVSWYDDSKATTPAAVLAGVAGFSSVVLIAGGRNKGLDLTALSASVPPVRAVVAIGEAAADVAAAFAGRTPVRRAASMSEAVAAAGALAGPGDAVVLSPGCASFDWYSSYGERGRHFAALVRERLEKSATAGGTAVAADKTIGEVDTR